jgi:hypothetical protein
LFSGIETEMVEACEKRYFDKNVRLQQKLDTVVQSYLQLNLYVYNWIQHNWLVMWLEIKT